MYDHRRCLSPHRETFESAHSVVLGIFAAHAQKVSEAGNSNMKLIWGFRREPGPFLCGVFDRDIGMFFFHIEFQLTCVCFNVELGIGMS
jgi:hypothetical protein